MPPPKKPDDTVPASPEDEAFAETVREAGATKPAELAETLVCARSGLLPSPHCHERKLEWFVVGQEPEASCEWHRPSAGGFVEVHYPELAREWGEQARHEGGRDVARRAR